METIISLSLYASFYILYFLFLHNILTPKYSTTKSFIAYVFLHLIPNEYLFVYVVPVEHLIFKLFLAVSMLFVFGRIFYKDSSKKILVLSITCLSINVISEVFAALIVTEY